MNGGEALVATLLQHGVTTAFCVPGESYLAVLEALRRHASTIRLVTHRHESGAAFAANGYAKISGRPGVVLASRGPGATNAAIGIHTAAQDSVPVVLIVGQVPSHEIGHEAFQEIDYTAFYGAVAKAVIEPASAADVADATARALSIAASGRPGPVVVALPEDITLGDAGAPAIPQPMAGLAARASQDELERAASMIDAADRVLVLAGEMVRHQAAHASLELLARQSGAAVVSAFRCQDCLSNDHEAYAGSFATGRAAFLDEAWDEADLVVIAGARFDAVSSADFRFRDGSKPLVVIHPDAATVAALRPCLGLVSDISPALETMARRLAEPPPARLAWRDALREAWTRFQEAAPAASGRVDMAAIVHHVNRRLASRDHIVSNDAGNFATWVQRHFRYRLPASQVGPMSGAMGYGIPAAVGAALARPDARVVAFAGDGGFMMTGQELTIAVEHALKVIAIVCDNGHYGTILMHQQRYAGPENTIAVALRSPDFRTIGEAYGAPSWRVERTQDFAPAFDEALCLDGPALIHVVTDIRDLAAGVHQDPFPSSEGTAGREG